MLYIPWFMINIHLFISNISLRVTLLGFSLKYVEVVSILPLILHSPCTEVYRSCIQFTPQTSAQFNSSAGSERNNYSQ